MRFTTRALRSSVVHVVAAFVPLAGCVEELSPDVVSNPPACGSQNTPGCIPDWKTELDAGVSPPGPRPVDAGVLDARAALDGGDASPPFDARVAFDAGDARVPTRDGGALDFQCPVIAPEQGGLCAVDAGARCSYGPDCYGAPTRQAACTAGRWMIYQSSCNPPPVPCPDAAPAENSACTPGFGPALCGYGSCDGGAATTYFCNGGSWLVTQRCGVLSCPSERPVQGAGCAYSGDPCGYDDCYGTPATQAACVNGAWQLSMRSCNPPPLDSCPGLTPVQGNACQHTTGNSCYFSLNTGALASADCVNGKWQVQLPDAGP